MNDHVYEYDKLVIGGSLASLVYAYHESLPIIWTEARLPFFFDKTKDGNSKLDIWHKMAFLLSMAGLAPLGDKAETIREEEDGTLKVIGKEPYFIRIKAKEVEYYDECLAEKEDTIFEVVDWVSVRSGMCHSHDCLSSEDDFIKHAYFYKTKRVDGNHDKKDAVCLSYMTRAQLLDVDYSETYIRLKLLDMMKEAGIKGNGNGNFRGKKRFLSLKIEPAHREYRVLDTKREDAVLEKYGESTPKDIQLAMWADVLGEPYD